MPTAKPSWDSYVFVQDPPHETPESCMPGLPSCMPRPQLLNIQCFVHYLRIAGPEIDTENETFTKLRSRTRICDPGTASDADYTAMVSLWETWRN